MKCTRRHTIGFLAIIVLTLVSACSRESELPTLSPLSTSVSPLPSATRRPPPTPTLMPTSPTPRPIAKAALTPSPTRVATSIPITALPTLPADFPHPPLAYQHFAQKDRAVSLYAGRLIAFDYVRLEVLSADDENVLWTYAPSTWRINSYMVADEMVLVLLYQRLDTGAQRRIGVEALRLKDGNSLWRQWFPPLETNLAVGQWMTVAAATVYLVDTNAHWVTALDIHTGNQRWQQENLCQPPAVASEAGLWLKCAGQFMHIEATTGVTATIDSITAAPLAYQNGYLVTTHATYSDNLPQDRQIPTTTLSVWSAPYAQPLWHVSLPGRLAGFWMDANTVVYRIGPILRRVSLIDGAVIWEITLPEKIGANLHVVDGVMLVGSSAGYLHAVDLESGFLLWTQDLWATLTPRPLQVLIIGMWKDAIFVQLDSALWAKLGVEGQTVWNLPAPTPDPTQTPAPAKIQLPHVTPPPPDWTPPPIEEVTPQNAQAKFEIFVNWLNQETTDVTQTVAAYLTWASPQIDPAGAPNWIRYSDLDQDGTDEMLVSVFQSPARYDQTCGTSYCPALLMLFERQGRLWIPAKVWEEPDEGYGISNPQLLLIEDINADGKLELILQTSGCGAHACFNSLQVGQWDGRALSVLGRMGQNYSEIRMVDQDNDGLKEIVMHGGTVGSAGAGMQRPRTKIYAWRDGAYQQVDEFPDFVPNNIYFLMLDANAALKAQDLDTALERALTAVALSGKQRGPWENSRIVSYSLIEAMLVYAMRGEIGRVEALLNEIETRYDQLENPYVEAAQRFATIYRETYDPLLACQALERTIREHGHVEFLEWYGYAMEHLALEDVCPLD